MRRNCLTLLLILSSLSGVFCQSIKSPKNLFDAIVILDKDCPDSLKLLIKETPDENLTNLLYPWDGDYRLIFDWTNNENSKLVKYLNKHGITYYVDHVIIGGFKTYLLTGKFNEETLLESFKDREFEMAEQERLRFTADSLYGEYIPKDLKDCFRQIDYYWNDSLKAEVRKMGEDDFVGQAHMSVGMWMRNNWQLWGGSRLSKYFNDNNVFHPDDMSTIILVYYHRYLNGIVETEEAMCHYYDDYYKESALSHLADFDIGDTVYFDYPIGFTSKKQKESYESGLHNDIGIVLEKDEDIPAIRIKLVSSFDKKGILYIDVESYEKIKDSDLSNEKKNKKSFKKLQAGKDAWFYLYNWAAI